MIPKLTQQVQQHFEHAVRDGAIPGVAAIATDAKSAFYEGAFGRRRLDDEAPMTLDTVAWIASMTKAITGAAAMQLVEQGRINLDAPATQHLPMLGNARVLTGFDAQGQPIMRAPSRPITLRHLLTHTAGFGYDTWNEEVPRYMAATGLPSLQTGELRALAAPLLSDPGERWNYSIAIDFAGLMVEAVSGLKLGEYMKRHLFEPLGMHDTAFRLTPALRARMAKIHQRDAQDALAVQPQFEIRQDPQFEAGGGGLYSTASDYAKFVRMILNLGQGENGRVLRPETVELMSRNSMGNLRVTEMRSVNPQRSRSVEFFPGLPKSWGLSFQINEADAPTGRSAGSLSWAGLGNSYFWIDPKKGIGGVYITQILPFADVRSLPLFLEFESAVYQHWQAG